MRLKSKEISKTPLDFIEPREELTPVQVRLPKSLLAEVKSKLEKNGLTFTDLVRGACSWYLDVADTPDGLLLKKKPR
jgi:predicted DNA binding CopG/RHH family protein